MIHEIEPMEPRREIALLQDGEIVPLRVRGVVMLQDRTVLLLQQADGAEATLTCQACGMPGRATGGAYPFVPGEVIHADTGLVECGPPLDHLAGPSIAVRRLREAEAGGGGATGGGKPRAAAARSMTS